MKRTLDVNILLIVSVKEADTYSSLPLECQLVNKTSLQSLVGNLPPVSRHFALKRKPKSAELRAYLMQKCEYVFQ